MSKLLCCPHPAAEHFGSVPATNVNNGNILRPVVSINNMILRKEKVLVRHHAQRCLPRTDRWADRQADGWMSKSPNLYSTTLSIPEPLKGFHGDLIVRSSFSF